MSFLQIVAEEHLYTFSRIKKKIFNTNVTIALSTEFYIHLLKLRTLLHLTASFSDRWIFFKGNNNLLFTMRLKRLFLTEVFPLI